MEAQKVAGFVGLVLIVAGVSSRFRCLTVVGALVQLGAAFLLGKA